MSKISFFFKIIFFIFLFSKNIIASDHPIYPKIKWPFEGILGKFDRQSAQRGFQVYKEICSACHSIKLLSYRNLTEIGFSQAEIKSIAAQYNLDALPDENGEIKQRPALPSDYFVPPFSNENAARAADSGALPVDFSLIIKARGDGANYVHALLTGYRDPPSNIQMVEGKYYNPYFPGQQISMPPPLHDNMITYIDGTEATKDQMARDIVNFLQWASEPEMEKRKYIGIKSIIYLVIMTVIFYLAKKRIWSRLEKE